MYGIGLKKLALQAWENGDKRCAILSIRQISSEDNEALQNELEAVHAFAFGAPQAPV